MFDTSFIAMNLLSSLPPQELFSLSWLGAGIILLASELFWPGMMRAIADATAESIEKMGSAIAEDKGLEAIRLQLSESYLDEIRAIATPNTSVLVPMDLAHLDSLLDGVGLGAEQK